MRETTERVRAILRPQPQPARADHDAPTLTGLRVGRPRRRLSRPTLGRIASGAILIALAICLLISSAGLDSILNRGVVYGMPTTGSGGLSLGMNVFLEKEVERENVVRSVQMLKAGGVTFVRQSFPWQEIEPSPGVYRDPKSGLDTWAKYDFIVEQLGQAGIGIMARVDTIPRWARPQTDNFERWDKGPPQDFGNYGNFVATLANRYKGKIAHFQVWNEPNLTGEWGGKPISPAQYGLLLKFTYERVKAVNPAALIVTAGLAQTDDNPTTNNMSELTFIQGLYDAGAQPYFDILSVMGYGIGNSPEDRRVGADRYNLSRLLLAREVMVRNGDAAKPIWVSEYGWISIPRDWKGSYDNYWGPSVDEATQARWTIEGLERARREWPWVGAIFVWGFRWVESPKERPDDAARYFEVVDHDFAPRPAYLALRDWSGTQRIVTSGAITIRDPRLAWQGQWRDQSLGGQNYRVASTDDAVVRLTFQGTEVHLRGRAGSSEGQVYVTIDGQPVRGLKSDDQGSYLLLREGPSAVHDQEMALVSGLTDGQHTLELRYGGFGQVALSGIVIGRQRPFDWAAALLFAAGLAGLFAGLVRLSRALAIAVGWLADGDEPLGRRRELAWWNTRE